MPANPPANTSTTVFAVVRVDGNKREDVALAPQRDYAETHRASYLAANPKVDPKNIVIEERDGDHHPTWSQQPDAPKKASN